MGNVCLKGFQSIYKALCLPQSKSPNKLQPALTDKHIKDPRSVQTAPPETQRFAKEEVKDELKVEVIPELKLEPKASRKVSLVKQRSKHTQSVKKPHEMKRMMSAGLQADRLLKTNNGNLKDFYMLGKKLGNGQFGTTYLCVEKKTNKQYACKSIAKRKLLTDDDIVDVKREIEIMHHLSGHPNVVSIKGAYEDAISVYLVMELCAGGELFDRIIEKSYYSERKAADLAKTIVIASKLSEEEIAGLKQMFKMIDTDNSGNITFEELKIGLKNFGANLEEYQIHDLMKAADINNNGIIDYEEFVAATLHLNKVYKEDSIYAAFSYFDKDGSGYITVNEVQQSCKELGIDDAQIDEIIKEVDLNNDGRIDYNEFLAMMQKESACVGRRQQKNSLKIGLREGLPVC
ncbi:hypothetical protein M8C21_030921 [Ambrosia artemisiifolia]|uniref:non-specific serine/threonine protein kinase n=1 Tax=Ambrosia artemisiifolia TaxID=4212 RepID=A0AAD5D6Y0_AMBAR|nr:hypothetical protein M8C21_030921 [Ambrosia artemisiifolia]